MKSLDTFDFTICIYGESDLPLIELYKNKGTISNAINFCRKLHDKNIDNEIQLFTQEYSTEPYLLFKTHLSKEELTLAGQLMIRAEFNLINI